jgi:Transposase DDE domain
MWTNRRRGRGFGEHITFRVIEYRVDGGEPIRLLTSLLDTDRYPAAALAALYAERWQIETGNLQIKTLRMGRGAILRSREPTLVRQEIWAHLTVNHALTRLMTLMADERGQDPERISFTKVLKEARRTVIQQAARTLATAARHATDIADNLRRHANPERPPRTSQRTLKRIRARFPPRPATTRDKPVTTKTPPRLITLGPTPQR